MTTFLLITLLIIGALGITAWWWRHYTLACPASLSWLVENPYINAVAGPAVILQRAKVKPGTKILDIGSGPGRLSLPAAKTVGPDGVVLAVDIQEKMLAKLRNKAEAQGYANLRTLHAGAGEGAIDQDTFDRALLVTVLGEIPDKQAALTEIHTALRDDGLLSITELIPDPHYQSRQTVRRICRNTGFEEIASYGNWFCFTMNFRKARPAQD